MILTPLTTFYLLCASAAAAPASVDPFEGAVSVVRYSFEADEDRDFDTLPDDWTRRKGAGFPHYVETAIDRTQGADGGQSLQFQLNGGAAAMYSPPTRIDSYHSYVFSGRIRTDRLKNDAAVFSVSFLNQRRERVQRFLTDPVSGTHSGWVPVRIGPVIPHDDVRYVVIGCHLITGVRPDIQGTVWFDDLRLARLPQLRLAGDARSHFREPGQGIDVGIRVSGIDPGPSYSVQYEMRDAMGTVIERQSRPVGRGATAEDPKGDSGSEPEVLTWSVPDQPHGHYDVRALLLREGQPLIDVSTAYAVMNSVSEARAGEFGWSVPNAAGALPPRELAELAAQAGVNWLKYPLWNSVSQGKSAEVVAMFDLLVNRAIAPIGLLNDPPDTLRRQFAREWTGVGEIFAMPAEFWGPSLEPVIARYSPNVRHWQLGDDRDASFLGLTRVPATLAAAKQQIDLVARDTKIGVRWDWNTAFPDPSQVPPAFVSLPGPRAYSPETLRKWLNGSNTSHAQQWLLLEPLSEDEHTTEARAADLVKRMLAARVAGAEGIFLADVFDQEHGLLRSDGSPTPLFLPWRSIALAIRGAEPLGSIYLPGGSRNVLFARDSQVIAVLWNDTETTEELALGDDVRVSDLWGRPLELKPNARGDRELVDVGPVPIIVTGCSEPIARWRLALRFERGKVESRYGGHDDAVVGLNPFPQGVNGTITFQPPPGWEIAPRKWDVRAGAGERFRLPMTVTLPPDANLGSMMTSLECDIQADRAYRFEVHQPYQVGLGDIGLVIRDRRRDDGSLEIEQVLTNKTEPEEVLNLRCSLFVPGRKRQRLFVTKLGHGIDRKLFTLPDADELRGKEFWLRAEQVDGSRVLNYRWIVGENWDEP